MEDIDEVDVYINQDESNNKENVKFYSPVSVH